MMRCDILILLLLLLVRFWYRILFWRFRFKDWVNVSKRGGKDGVF